MDPGSGKFGALSFITGSIGTTLIAILLGRPLGLAGAAFLAEIAPPWVRALMRPATDLFAGIPSVVYGYVGLTVIVGFIRKSTNSSTGYGILAAGIVLAIMILPTVISLSEDSIRCLPKAYKEASLALGATRWHHVLVPAASPGISTALVLGMARAIGETMAVQMVIGNSPRFPNPFPKSIYENIAYGPRIHGETNNKPIFCFQKWKHACIKGLRS